MSTVVFAGIGSIGLVLVELGSQCYSEAIVGDNAGVLLIADLRVEPTTEGWFDSLFVLILILFIALAAKLVKSTSPARSAQVRKLISSVIRSNVTSLAILVSLLDLAIVIVVKLGSEVTS